MDTFADLFTLENQGCHIESDSTFVSDDFGIGQSVISRFRTRYVETVTNGQRHGIRRARKVRRQATEWMKKNVLH